MLSCPFCKAIGLPIFFRCGMMFLPQIQEVFYAVYSISPLFHLPEGEKVAG